MARVVSITYTPENVAERKPKDRFARVLVPAADLRAGHGLVGDVKACPGERQLNVMRTEDVEGLRLEGFHTEPGELGEQVVIGGLTDAEFRNGIRLRIGSTAVVEIGMPREPCGRFEQIQGIKKERAINRIGVMARVIADGSIAAGDEVVVAR